MRDFLLFEAKMELSRRLDVSPHELEYVGLQDFHLKDNVHAPLFKILDKSSPLYMSTKAAYVFVKWDVITQRIVQVENISVPDLKIEENHQQHKYLSS